MVIGEQEQLQAILLLAEAKQQSLALLIELDRFREVIQGSVAHRKTVGFYLTLGKVDPGDGSDVVEHIARVGTLAIQGGLVPADQGATEIEEGFFFRVAGLGDPIPVIRQQVRGVLSEFGEQAAVLHRKEVAF